MKICPKSSQTSSFRPRPFFNVDDALKTFTIHKDFVIEAVVAEPLVDKPVALAFDARGRMWVCEMRGYMADIDGTTEDVPQGRITILEDTTGDGKVDKRIDLPRGYSSSLAPSPVVPWRNSLRLISRISILSKLKTTSPKVHRRRLSIQNTLPRWKRGAQTQRHDARHRQLDV